MSEIIALEDWKKLTVGIFGLGKSGLAAASALLQLGANVVGFDSRAETEILPAAATLEKEIQVYAENKGFNQLKNLDYAVISPGIPPHSPAWIALQEEQIPLWSEVELAWQIQQSLGKNISWLTVTGTNGKTTTVGLVGSILAAAGAKYAVVGNVGEPIVTTVLREDVEVLAVELSSFQLQTTYSLSPLAAVCLNVDADHLDWHGSVEDYWAAKARIYEHTQVACVYDGTDRAVEKMIENADVVEGARAISYTLGTPGPSQIGLVEDLIVDRAFVENRQQQAEAVAQISDIYGFASASPSVALVKDTLAAVALTRAYGVDSTAIVAGLRSFKAAKHRRAIVGEVADMLWIDDSKATNTHAAAASLVGFPPQSVVWIAGGDTKGQNLNKLVSEVKEVLRGVVVIGADPTPVVSALKTHTPNTPFVVVDGHDDMMFSVVNEAVALSRPGDTVVLAPACASWDQFANYGQRGDLFAQAVDRLKEAWIRQYGASETLSVKEIDG